MPSTCQNTILGVGDTQSMVFKTDDCGPWYLTPDQRDLQRRDRTTGKSKVAEKTKKALLEELNETGVILQQKRGYTKRELQDLARENGIETHKEVDKNLPGWEGKSKGLLQVLWERGSIRYETSLPVVLILRMKKPHYNF